MLAMMSGALRVRRRVGRRVGAIGARAQRVAAWWLVASLAGSAMAQAEPARASGALGVVSDGLLLFGCAFLLAAAIGLLRFPDFYVRLHATTKLVTLGGVGIFGGAAIAFAPVQATERVLLIALFFFLTAPLSGYMIARAGYLRGIEPYREDTSVDEWGALGHAATEMPDRDDAVDALR